MKKILNLKMTEKQHSQLKELSEHYGFTMTGYLHHLVLNEYNRLNQLNQLPVIQKMFKEAKELKPEQLSLFQLGEKV
jgi:hypothetical protein